MAVLFEAYQLADDFCDMPRAFAQHIGGDASDTQQSTVTVFALRNNSACCQCSGVECCVD